MRPGDDLPAFVVPAIDLGRMKLLAALMRDPNPIHWDAEATRRAGLGEKPVNQGPANMAYVMNMLAAVAGDAGVRGLRLRFLGAACAGDSVAAQGRVAALRRAGGETLADCDVRLERGDGALLMQGSATIALEGDAERAP